MMRLPRLTTRRLMSLAAVAGGVTLSILIVARSGDEPLALAAIAILALLCVTIILPFLAALVSLRREVPLQDGERPRPPRLPRVTTRRLRFLIVVVAVVYGAARLWVYLNK